MIRSFSDPRFEARIRAGIKIHTIREDKHNRWKPGMKIHFWMHNPRNVKKNPYTFGEGVVYAVREIDLLDSSFILQTHAMFPWDSDLGKLLAKRDGFDSVDEMKAYFKLPFYGKVIIWKNCKWY